MGFLKKLFRITPFTLSLAIVFVFLFITIIHDINPKAIALISALDQKAIDLKFKMRGIQKAKSKIAILAADDKSFQALGQWPWDRTTVFGPLIDTVCKYNPKVISFDLVWSERERNVSGGIRKALAQSVGGQAKLDAILAKGSGDYTFHKSVEACISKIVLGYSLARNADSGIGLKDFQERANILIKPMSNVLATTIRGKTLFARNPDDPDANHPFYFNAANGLLNIPEITPEKVAQGFMNNDEDGDGNYRRAMMLFRLQDEFVASLPLRAAQKGLDKADTPPTLLIKPYLPEKDQSHELKLELATAEGPRAIPVDLTGRANVNFRGPNHIYPNVSISDVLAPSEELTYEQVDELGRAHQMTTTKAEFFKDAYLFVGVTASSLYDIRPRPFDAQASGVENHANILDNILNNDFLVRPTTGTLIWTTFLAALFSLLFGYGVGKLDAKLGAVAALGTVAIVLFIDQVVLFNRRGVIFPGHLLAIQLLIQYLAVTVLRFMQEESEKRFIRSAFDKYVSPAIVDSMLKDPSKLRLGGEKKELSVLFSDIRGFTELSEKVDVKQLTQFLNEYLGAMTEILQRNNGTLDKYIGDAVMGFWGAPVDLSAHATLSVKTAVEMLAKLDELNEQFQQKYGFKIDIGIGINSGAVSVGNFGSSKVFEYTVIGDNVNLASRLEGINKYYGTHIIISETTFQHLKPGEFLTREVDTVKVKGKQKPVKIYEVFPDTAKYAPLKSKLRTFSEGLTSYYSKRWDQAVTLFREVLKECEGDRLSVEMIERCTHYKNNPPNADWDGSWEMQSK